MKITNATHNQKAIRRTTWVLRTALACAMLAALPGCGAAQTVYSRATDSPAPTVTPTPKPAPTPTPTPTPEPELTREEELELLGFKEGPELHEIPAVRVLRYRINDEIKIMFAYYIPADIGNEDIMYDCFNDTEVMRIPFDPEVLYTVSEIPEVAYITNPALEGAELLDATGLSVLYDWWDVFIEITFRNTKYDAVLINFAPYGEYDIPYTRREIADMYLDIVPKTNRICRADLLPPESGD